MQIGIGALYFHKVGAVVRVHSFQPVEDGIAPSFFNATPPCGTKRSISPQGGNTIVVY